MVLANTGKAIGEVSWLLKSRIDDHFTSSNITDATAIIGRPVPLPTSDGFVHAYLFLYEALFDPHLKNISLDEGRPAHLWLVLKYLLTVIDKGGNSDSVEAHKYLGEAVRALQALSFLHLKDTGEYEGLRDNPEFLKITFDEASSDLISKLMQGHEEKYQFSMAFQVRPIMIAPDEPPSYSLLVGVDYTQPEPTIIGEEGVHLSVSPFLGPHITEIKPPKFEPGTALKIYGSGLDISDLVVSLGPVDLPVVSHRSDELECAIGAELGADGAIAAGSHPISVTKVLPNERRRSSNLLIGNLLPVLTTAGFNLATGLVTLSGSLLGRDKDDIIVGLHDGTKVVKMFDSFTETEDQKMLTFEVSVPDDVPAGTYRVILRVNGQQAKFSPEVELTGP